MVEFNAAVLETHAIQLLNKANRTILARTVLGILLGLAASMVIPQALSKAVEGQGQAILLFMGAAGGFLGYLWGKDAALMIQVQAQQILCQVAIERNTRKQAAKVAEAQ